LGRGVWFLSGLQAKRRPRHHPHARCEAEEKPHEKPPRPCAKSLVDSIAGQGHKRCGKHQLAQRPPSRAAGLRLLGPELPGVSGGLFGGAFAERVLDGAIERFETITGIGAVFGHFRIRHYRPRDRRGQ